MAKLNKKENTFDIDDNGNLIFTKKNVKNFLDFAIRRWRRRRKNGSRMAKYYIDAYQSVRVSLFGEVLKWEK